MAAVKEWIFFQDASKKKVYCSCNHWDIPSFSQRGDFLFCFVFFLIFSPLFSFKKCWEMAEQLEKLQEEMEVLRNKQNG